ncbi:MAG: complex I NDUFA9 subunit family protein [Alphaproteobacteria bacterium]
MTERVVAGRVATVFGGSGFIGRHLIGRLARQGWIVRVAVRHPSRAGFLKPMGEVGQVTPIRAPIQDQIAVESAIAGADAVINLVGILYERGPQTFSAVHAHGAQAVATAAAAAGVEHLVQVSALGADHRGEADYARSKGTGEAAVRAAFPNAVILRPSVVFGPEDGFFNRFAMIARLSPVLPLIGGGGTRFQPVYVGDVADAITRSAADPACAGQTFELGGPHVYTFKELMELLLRQIHRRRLLVPWPFALAEFQARFFELLPVPPLTRDQVRMLHHDNVVTEAALTLADLGIVATAAEVILPSYLDRYRPGGRFDQTQPA